MNIEYANRIKNLPLYIFAELEKIILEKKKKGMKIISLSIGDPDLPPPKFILEALKEEIIKPENHKYSLSQGEADFREAISNWYKKRFGVDINPEKEVIALIGSKEGIANVSRAFINPGDKVLVPDPAYPVYSQGSTILSDGIPIVMPLLEENDFKPKLWNINVENVKMMFLNYPNNPTTAISDENFLKEIVEFAIEKNIILCYDNAYSEITFDGYKAPSILEIENAKEIAIEFHSLSKTFNMTGDRIAFAVGNEKIIEGLKKIKSQIDSGPSIYIQKVAIKALESYESDMPPEFLKENLKIYKNRRDFLIKKLNEIGFKVKPPKATFYVWLKCEENSLSFSEKLLNVGVVVTPGIGFGKYGENYVRLSLTKSINEIEEACEKISKIL